MINNRLIIIEKNKLSRFMATIAYMLLLTPMILVIFIYYRPMAIAGLHYDDSFITYRYALNLSRHGELVFNLGDYVNSASSFIYTILLALFDSLGIAKSEVAAIIIGILSSSFAIILLYILTFRITQSKLLSFFLISIVSTSGGLIAWTVSGMESAFFVFLVTAFLASIKTEKPFVLIILSVLIVLTRPEGVIHPILLALSMSFMRKQISALWFGQILKSIAAAMLTFVGYLLFNYLYYGDFMPYAGYFKLATIYYYPSLKNNSMFLVKQYYILLLLSFNQTILFLISIKQKRYDLFRLMITLGSWIVTGMYIVGPREDYGRYLLAALPYHVVSVAYVFNWFGRNVSRKWAFGLGLLIMFSLLCCNAFFSQKWFIKEFQRISEHQSARLKVGRFISTKLSNDFTILSADVGAIAYMAWDHRVIDLYGLTNKEVFKIIISGTPDDLKKLLGRYKKIIIADTVWPDGNFAALEILENPLIAFRNAPKDRTFSGIISVGETLYDVPSPPYHFRVSLAKVSP